MYRFLPTIHFLPKMNYTAGMDEIAREWAGRSVPRDKTSCYAGSLLKKLLFEAIKKYEISKQTKNTTVENVQERKVV